MIELKYIASSGNVYNLKGDGIRTKKANYHAWKWGVTGTTLQYGIRISNFTRKPVEYTTQLIFSGSYESRRQMINALHEDFELDIRNGIPGRVIWGEYYIDCFMAESSTEPDVGNVWTKNDVKIYCPYPFWIKEETKSFYPAQAPVGQEFLDYPYDYEYDYFYGNPGSAVWDTEFPFASDFKMTIYGLVSNPRVLVNGYPYQINTDLAEDEYLIIDSRDNTIQKYIGSQVINIFDSRDKTKSVFQPMPGGALRFNWSGAFGFDLTLFEERSEPR